MRIDRKKLMIMMYDAQINQKGLSQVSGLSRSTINSIRGGKSCSEETAQKISRALKVDLADILE